MFDYVFFIYILPLPTFHIVAVRSNKEAKELIDTQNSWKLEVIQTLLVLILIGQNDRNFEAKCIGHFKLSNLNKSNLTFALIF